MTLGADLDLTQQLSAVDWESFLRREGLEPKASGKNFIVKCPKCGKHECVFFPNRDTGKARFECNRKNECQYKEHVLSYLNGGSFPEGEAWKECLSQVTQQSASRFQIPAYHKQKNDQEYKGSEQKDASEDAKNIDSNLLRDYWEYLQKRFSGSLAEEYVKQRGLNPNYTPFGFFPGDVKEVISWGEEHGYDKETLEEASLIRKGVNGYFVFMGGRLAGAFIDQRGRFHNLWGRDLTGKAEGSTKYLNLQNSRFAHKKSPYGAEWITGSKVVWVEGYLDAVALNQCGIQAVASGSSHISQDMLSSLREISKLIIALDKDRAGKSGSLKLLKESINNQQPAIWFVDSKQMKGCKDFAELYQSHGCECVKTALAEENWIHRYQALAVLLIELNSANIHSLTSVECENICHKAYELDELVSTDRVPEFEKYFWRTICSILDYEMDTVLSAVENKRERLRKEQTLKQICSKQKTATEAISKGDVKSFRNVHENISKDLSSLDSQNEAIRLLDEVYTREDLRTALAQKTQGIKTGLIVDNEEIELATEGVTTLSLPTSHGKTTLSCCITINAINLHQDLEVVYISFEESKEKITSRLAHRYIDIELSKDSLKTLQSWYTTGKTTYFNNRTLPAGFLEKEALFWNLLDTKRLTILAPENKSIDNLLTIAQAAIDRRPNLKLVVIDYLQLIDLPERSRDARHDQLKQICDQLMQFGRNNGIAILCPAQFNRTVTKEEEVCITAIGEAGSIERFSDQVIGGWNRMFSEWGLAEPKMRINILKNRYGRIRQDLLSWDGNLGKVETIQRMQGYEENDPQNLYQKKATPTSSTSTYSF